MTKVSSFLRGNAIALTALFVALGGTSYAVASLPAGSVGVRQIRNGAVTPIKLDRGQIGGTVRAWAYVSADGKLLAGHGLTAARSSGSDYGLTLRDQHDRGCAATASVAYQVSTAPFAPGSAPAVLSFNPRPAGVVVNTFNAAGQPARLPFVVEVLC